MTQGNFLTLQIEQLDLSIKLKSALGHLCVVLNVQGVNPVYDLYPNPIIVVSINTCVSLPLPNS